MSLTYITKCDACKIRLDGWDDDIQGWAAVTLHNGMNNDRLDFCPDCWKKMADAAELWANVDEGTTGSSGLYFYDADGVRHKISAEEAKRISDKADLL